MKFWLHRLRHWWNRPRGQSQTIELKPLATGRPSGPGHWIPVALKRAMEQGQWERASNLVDETDHLVRTWPLVAEQVARFHLALGRPDVALKTIDEAIFRTSELRLLQNVCRALEGHTVEAMADLDRWSDHPSFPVVASTLLALLKIEHDEIDDAWSLLDANLKNHEDPMSLACLFVLCKERGMTECASKLARRLQSTFGPGRSPKSFEMLLTSFDVACNDSQICITKHQVESLARELSDQESLIPVLVAAQRLEHDPQTATLLERVLQRLLPTLENPQPAYEGLVHLTKLRGDLNAARTWARQGVEAHPHASGLARQQRELDQSSPSSSITNENIIASIGPDKDQQTYEDAA